MNHIPVSMVAALGKDRGLGKENRLLWSIPDDLKRFRDLTSNHVLIMGRKTFDSILSYRGAPLPNRTNIVVTRDTAWEHEGVMRANSIEEAIKLARTIEKEEIFIGGGAQIYEAAVPYTDRLYLTLIEDEKEADSYFPSYEHLFTTQIHSERHEHNGIQYRFVNLERP